MDTSDQSASKPADPKGAATPILEMRGIGKRFPGVVALDGVSFKIMPSEVLGLIGENGAGKSTLMKILGGIHQPTSGEVLVDGKAVQINNVNDSMGLGIAFIHQELNVLDNIDVAGNVFLGREPRTRPFQLIDRRKIESMTQPYLERLGLKISPRTLLGDLSIAQQQMVEIAKALSINARVIIMDEPSSSLTLQETNRLLELVIELKQQGVSVIYISHRLSELDTIADRIVGLRDGRNAGELSKDQIHHDAMVRLMVGREIEHVFIETGAEVTPGYLKVREMQSRRFPSRKVSFDAARGEILGVAGLVGAGRSELFERIFGIDHIGDGSVHLGGEAIHIHGTRDAINHGIYLVPEDRRGKGLVTEMAIRENIPLPNQAAYISMGLIQTAREREASNKQKESLKIKAPTVESAVVNLSGGNQQKVVLGKWLSMQPRVLVFDEPTRGIDVGAKSEIYDIMRDLARNGCVIIMISSDMEEVLHVSDRVMVMHEGKITGMLERAHCNEENIMQLAVGGKLSVALSPVAEGMAATA